MLQLDPQISTVDHGLLKKHGRSFYWASFFLAQKARNLAATLYAFCRWVDDAVDEADSQAEAFRNIEKLQRILATQGDSYPQFENLFTILGQYGLGMDPAEELIRGVKSDLQDVLVQNEEELLLYCYRVAGTVGLMMCPILGVREEPAMRYAIDLGIAMQLTNISRDVLEDAHRKRIYLPQSWMPGEVGPQDILHDPSVRNEIPKIVDRALKLAELHYHSAISGLVYIPWRARLAICVALSIYRQIGVKIQREWNGDSLRGRMFVKPVEKIFCIFKGIYIFGKTLFKTRPGRVETMLAKHSSLKMLPGVN